MLKAKILAVGLCLGMWLMQPAWAGRSCDAAPSLKAETVVQGMTLAERTQKALDASGAQVVILARAGQDLSKYGLRYSHLGLAYQVDDGQGGRVWRVLHKLNECGTANAYLYRQGLGEFFLDDLWRYEAAWVVPAPQVQARLYAWLNDPANAASMNVKPYSMVSYAWGTQYQQSNQWALETLAAAMEPDIRSRDQAQAWLKFKGYQPTALTIRPITRLGGRATRANIAFDDHPNEKRFSDRIETVTVDSVFDWMQQAKMGQAPVKLAL